MNIRIIQLTENRVWFRPKCVNFDIDIKMEGELCQIRTVFVMHIT